MRKDILNQVIKLRKILHNSPEISNCEFKTRKILNDFIRKETSYEIYNEEGWFYCLKNYNKNKKTILVRADYDAIVNSDGIPFHGCGHDGHSAILAGLMMEMEDLETDNNIIYLFQGAEETGSGALKCLKLFDKYKVDMVLGMHNMPGFKKNSINYRYGSIQCASVGYRFNLTGKQSHASEPEKGLNPAYEISRFAGVIEQLSEFNGYIPFKFENIDFSSLVMVTIINIEIGSLNFGISPACGSISLTLRAEKDEDLFKLENYIKNYFVNLKSKFEVDFKEFDRFPENYCDIELTRECINKLEGKFEVVEMDEPIRTSEDFGHYKKFAPSAFFMIGMGDVPSLHNDNYEFDDEIIETAVEMFKELII